MDEYSSILEQKALAELEALDRVRDERKRNRGIDYYRPNPIQMKVHASNARITCFVAGNRSGKSTVGAVELTYHLTKQYPDWFAKERRFKGPIRAMISATEFPIVTRVIEPKMKAFLPKGHYRIKRSNQGYMSRIEYEDGSTVDVLTSEMANEAYESADWDFGWLDEPQQKRKYEAILRGLTDRGGFLIITFTPLTEPWMKEDIVDKEDGKNISVFYGSTTDNLFTVDGEPILRQENIDFLEQNISEEMKDSRLHGQFLHLKGVVYQEFGEPHLVHCEHPNLDPAECDYHYRYPDPVICVLDPHDRVEHHVIWAYVNRQDDIVVDYEMITRCELDDLAKKIVQVEQSRGYKMRKRLIDPNFGRKPYRPGGNRTVMQELACHGASFYESNDSIEIGHMVVRDYLHFRKDKPLSITNKPKLFFARVRCPKTTRSMKNYQYEDWSTGGKVDKDKKETPKDKDDHGADCIRYLCISKPTFHQLTYSVEKNYELEEAPY